ncbi:feruloyl-CoA synthase [Marinobacterium nitratireducens]|uniref:Feruloyl-CoA synthase n=1 Tax=Marinobacterium nitratireducens TaxID=518897 RepID=A0A917ZIS9_9GAMM|nr:feruloyl-CoA synthase [Marinobacterium nitratireducens]GGO83431.1 feruloyl-CoA synthase [Marinobacterium nitratireducens]
MNISTQIPPGIVYRPVSIGHPDVEMRQEDGTFYLSPREALAAYPERLLERLQHWAEVRPEQTFVAQRRGDGDWQRISYRDMLARVRKIAQSLVGLNLSQDRPLLILSGNDLEHLQMALGAMYAGVPHSPVSPPYSLIAQDFTKLEHIVNLIRPGLVFAASGERFARAIIAVVPADTPVVVTEGSLPDREALSFDSLLAPEDCSDADRAYAATGPDTIAKFLFTSGSTKLPKAVTTTQRMLCANQQMLLQTFPVFGEEPPVLVDWLPWNHTFGGSHNVGIALYNGGTLYIDDGKPTPQLFEQTLQNLREISPTAYLTVPKGWEELANALEADAQLRERFFKRMKLFFFAGAALSQPVWNRLDRIAEAHCGERIRMMAGLGMTETAPSCTFTTGPVCSLAGYVGLPAPGCEVKLTPVNGKLEARFRGPHVMPGYWRSEELTQQAFDEDGYYCTGDALRFMDPEQPHKGLMFDGRIAEDFKLSSGVFVSVGPLRTRAILKGAPYVQDVVVTAPDRDRLGLMVFPDLRACRDLAGLPSGATPSEVIAAPAVREWLQGLLGQLNEEASGSSNRIDRACLQAEPPSLDLGEVTDKGSINQSAVLKHRADRVDALYEGRDSDIVFAG